MSCETNGCNDAATPSRTESSTLPRSPHLICQPSSRRLHAAYTISLGTRLRTTQKPGYSHQRELSSACLAHVTIFTAPLFTEMATVLAPQLRMTQAAEQNKLRRRAQAAPNKGKCAPDGEFHNGALRNEANGLRGLRACTHAHTRT
jgi:hypothetical protein